MNIRVLTDVIGHIKKNKKMYLGTDLVRPSVLAGYIADDAIVLGACQVVIRHEDPWYLVASDIDWLLTSHDDKELHDIFTSFIGLEGGGVNALRREPVLMAFSKNILVSADGKSIDIIKGNYEGKILENFVAENDLFSIKRILAFSCE